MTAATTKTKPAPAAYRHVPAAHEEAEGTQIIRNRDNGQPIPNFKGICRVYFDDGPAADFHTWIDQNGERNWRCFAVRV